MTNADQIIDHLAYNSSMTIKEAMDKYRMSGGSVTGTITLLRDEGWNIVTHMKCDRKTGRRYAEYQFAQPIRLFK
jgi:hypothetical protein